MIRRSTICALGVALSLAAPLTAATFTVNNTLDSGAGSLRWAITQANANGVADTIQFNIPGPGVQTIAPLTPLPPLTDPAGVLIDGFTQPGAGAGANPPATAALLIEITGTGLAAPAEGLSIQSNANVVQGLIVNQFPDDGIHIEGGLANLTADGNVLYCNFVGTDSNGTVDLGNGIFGGPLRGGVHISNVAGGTAINNAVDSCLVSGNWADGIWIQGPIQPGQVGFNTVFHCYVGTDITGTLDLGNDHDGITLTEGTNNNVILSNLSSGNDYAGIGMTGFNNIGFGPPILTSFNAVDLNIIGLDVTTANPLPNTQHGVSIGEYGGTIWGCATDNMIVSNAIAYNGWDGIAVVEDQVDTWNADRNHITQNAIWSNGGLGIDLVNNGVTPNDLNDPDVGANEELNFPVILNVVYAGTLTTVSGGLDIDTAMNLATIELFRAVPDASGNGEGDWYLGSTAPDAAGNWSFVTDKLVPGDLVTATTTDMNANSSEFCHNALVPGTPTLTSTRRTLSSLVPGQIVFNLSAGAAYAGRGYVMVGSVSGTIPGTPLPLVNVPINYDWFTVTVLNGLNGPFFRRFVWILDATGSGTARLNVLGPLGPGWIGQVLHFSYVLMSPMDWASNPVAVEIVPW